MNHHNLDLLCISQQFSELPQTLLEEIIQILESCHIKINLQEIQSTRDDTLYLYHFPLATTEDITNLKDIQLRLFEACAPFKVDIGFSHRCEFQVSKRLFVFDVDSTLIQAEVIDRIAALCGIEEKVAKITEEAMNGRIDFNDALKERVKLLAGLPQSKLLELIPMIKLSDGLEEFTRRMKKKGYKLAMLSGGFDFFVNHLKTRLGFDYAYSNVLEVGNDGKLTGKTIGPIINADMKAFLLEDIANKENITLKDVVAVGDGANDLKMMNKAGLSVGYHPKEIVKKHAKQAIIHGPMTTLCHFVEKSF